MGNYNTDISFWDDNPDLTIMEPFASFRNSDKSKGRQKSSQVMWAITIAESQDSTWYHLPDKYEKLATDFLKDPLHKWSSYEHLIEQYRSTKLTQAQRSLIAWNEMMLKRDRYLKNQDYYFDQYDVDENGDNVTSRTGAFITVKGTAEQLDKAFSTTPKMYSDYEKIKKMLEEENNTYIAVDGSSLTQQREI
jgi:hypothetical protein